MFESSWNNLYQAMANSLPPRNNRRLDNKFNIFEGISRNWFFIGINIITVCGQVLIIFFGSSALSTIRLDSTQWAISLTLGALSLPVAVLIRLIPDQFIRDLVPTRPEPYIALPHDDRFQWNPALEDVRDQLRFFKSIHGGRLNSLTYKKSGPLKPGDVDVPYRESVRANGNGDAALSQHTLERSRSRSSTALGPAAVMAGIVAGSIAGWSPTPIPRSAEDETPPDERTRLLG